MTTTSPAFSAFSAWRGLVASRAVPVVLARPRPFDQTAAFEGDYDYLIDPTHLAELVRLALDATAEAGASVELDQRAPAKTRLRFLDEGGEPGILVELWPHAVVTSPGGSRHDSAIAWDQLAPHWTAEGGLPDEVLGLVYLTHLHDKDKDLEAPEVRERLGLLDAELCGPEGPSATGQLIRALRDGDIDAAEGSRRAIEALAVLGVAVRPLPSGSGGRVGSAIRRRVAHLARTAQLGRVVNVVGPDGAGKSALQEAVAGLGTGGPPIHTYRFKGAYRKAFAMRVCARWWGRSERGGSGAMARNLVEERHVATVLRIAILRWPLVRARLALKARASGGGGIALVDRYFWDYLVTVRNPDTVPAPIPHRAAWSRRAWRPTAAVVVACRADVIRNRKQELSIPAIELLYDTYCEELVAKRVTRALIVSTECELPRSALLTSSFLRRL